MPGYGANPPTPLPVTLRFVFSDRAKESKYQDAAKAFKLKYPRITVEVRRVNNVPLQLSMGSVDVSEAEQFDFSTLVQRNAVRDLTPILESAVDFPANDFYPRLLDLFRQGGKLWGIPANVDPWVVFYNKDLFTKMNVPYPQPGWTWEDFLLAARGVSIPMENPPQYGFVPDPYGLGVWSFVYQHGGRVVDNLVQPTKATLDDPRVIEAVQWYADLATKHNVMPVVTSATDPQYQAMMNAFLRGKVGMWMLSLSERGGIAGSRPWAFSWGVVPLPQDKERITFLMASGYFISAGTTYPRESWLWIEYLTKEAVLDWDVPPRRSVAKSEAYRKRVGEEIFAVAQEAAEYGMTLPAAAWLTQIPGESINFVADVMAGKKTAAEALQDVQRQWDAAIQRFSK